MMEFYTNITNCSLSDQLDSNSISSYKSVVYVVELVIICTGLPLTLLAIVAVYSLVRKDHVAPVYVINLLISDLLQLCCMTARTAGRGHFISNFLYFFGLMASIGFMVCISLERYLVIAKPLWYRFRRSIKTSVAVCMLVWTLPLGFVLPVFLTYDDQIPATLFAVFLLLPLLLFIFFLVGTLKALSAARSVPADEKRRIVAVLVVVLLIYTLLCLPGIIWGLKEEARENHIFNTLTYILICFSPLADSTLYFLIRKGVVDQLRASMCCKAAVSNSSSCQATSTP